MKNILGKYFEDLKKVYMSVFNTSPTISYSEDLNKELFISTVDENGEIEWEPSLIKNSLNFDKLEKVFNLKFSNELKEYYSTFSFFYITGNYKNIYLWLFPLNDKNNLEQNIREHFSDGKYYFKDKEVFVLGGASIDNVDGLYICYDNKNNNIFCYDSEEDKTIDLSINLRKFLNEIEASI